MINNYFGHEIRSGHCPPRLAKKQNGCLPLPPLSLRYMRVGGDVLLLSRASPIVAYAIGNIIY